jgi:hypothetical protein
VNAPHPALPEPVEREPCVLVHVALHVGPREAVGREPSVAAVSATTVRRFGARWLTWSLTLWGASPPNTVTALSSASMPRLAWSGPQGLASTRSAIA